MRARCLDELDILSKKRIKCLLEGNACLSNVYKINLFLKLILKTDKQMLSSSGTDDSSEGTDVDFENPKESHDSELLFNLFINKFESFKLMKHF